VTKSCFLPYLETGKKNHKNEILVGIRDVVPIVLGRDMDTIGKILNQTGSGSSRIKNSGHRIRKGTYEGFQNRYPCLKLFQSSFSFSNNGHHQTVTLFEIIKPSSKHYLKWSSNYISMWHPPILIFYVTDKARARREEGRRCRCYERRIYHIKRKKDEKQRKKSFFQILQHRLWANRVKLTLKLSHTFFF